MRYPYEVNLVGDAATDAAGADPAAAPQGRPVLARGDRGQRGALVGDHGCRGDGGRRPGQPDAAVRRAVAAAARRRDRHRRLRVVGELVRPPAAVPRRHARLAVRQPGDHGPGGAVRDRRQVRPPRPAGDRVRRRRRDADERPGRADHDQALLAAVGGPAAGRRRPAQQRPQPGHLGDAGDGGRAEVRRVPDPARRRLRRLRRRASAWRPPSRSPTSSAGAWEQRAVRGPADGARRPHRPRRAARSRRTRPSSR